jgi:hypothetical protein
MRSIRRILGFAKNSLAGTVAQTISAPKIVQSNQRSETDSFSGELLTTSFNQRQNFSEETFTAAAVTFGALIFLPFLNEEEALMDKDLEMVSIFSDEEKENLLEKVDVDNDCKWVIYRAMSLREIEEGLAGRIDKTVCATAYYPSAKAVIIPMERVGLTFFIDKNSDQVRCLWPSDRSTVSNRLPEQFTQEKLKKADELLREKYSKPNLFFLHNEALVNIRKESYQEGVVTLLSTMTPKTGIAENNPNPFSVSEEIESRVKRALEMMKVKSRITDQEPNIFFIDNGRILKPKSREALSTILEKLDNIALGMPSSEVRASIDKASQIISTGKGTKFIVPGS